MNRRDILSFIESVIDDVVGEVSTTASAGSYDTPMAFSRKKLQNKKRPVTEASYKELKSDMSRSNIKKIGECMSRVDTLLREADRLLTHSNRLKSEYAVANEALWKTTQQRSRVMEQRTLNIITKLRNMRA